MKDSLITFVCVYAASFAMHSLLGWVGFVILGWTLAVWMLVKWMQIDVHFESIDRALWSSHRKAMADPQNMDIYWSAYEEFRRTR